MLMFVGIIAGKVWTWIGEGRLETLERQPLLTSKLCCIRFSIALLISLSFDSFMVMYAVNAMQPTTGPNMMVLVALEFGVMTISSMLMAIRFAFSVTEIFILEHQNQEALTLAWGEKSRWMAHLNLTTGEPRLSVFDSWVNKGELLRRWLYANEMFLLDVDFIKILAYLFYLSAYLKFSAVPVQIIRDTFSTVQSFTTRAQDFLRHQRAIQYINDRYTDSTAGEIAREDVCVVCREEMSAWQQINMPRKGPGQVDEGSKPGSRATESTRQTLRPKRLPCGHILHLGCLKSWFETQTTCPTCRRPVHRSTHLRLT